MVAIAAFSVLTGAARAQQPSAIGFWVTPSHGAVVEISQCESGLCGRLVGLRTDHQPGEVPKDVHNSDPAKRGEPLCGLMMMGSLTPAKGSAPKWEGGWVYDPESGSTYKGEMHLEGADKLKLRGYVGISLFGRTQDWTREAGEAKNRCAPPASNG